MGAEVISTGTHTQLGRLQEAHVGSVECTLRPVHVIINNCGQIEKGRAHKCPFHTSLACVAAG